MPSAQDLSGENKVMEVEQVENHSEPFPIPCERTEKEGNYVLSVYSIRNKDRTYVYRLFTVSSYFFYYYYHFFACQDNSVPV